MPVAGYTASGFPIPYASFYPCCSGGGDAATGVSYFYDNTYIYHALNFVYDVTIWAVIGIGVALTFTVKRFVIGAMAGLTATLVSLLLAPTSSVYPFGGAETILYPMGFPYEFVVRYAGGLGAYTYAGITYIPIAAVADFGLWSGVAAVVVGLAFFAKANLPQRISWSTKSNIPPTASR